MRSGKPSRAWRALTSKDPRKPDIVLLCKGAVEEKTCVLGGLRLTNMKIRDGMKPILVTFDALRYRGRQAGRATRQDSYQRLGGYTVALGQPRPGHLTLLGQIGEILTGPEQEDGR